jgi:hypothetical protein
MRIKSVGESLSKIAMFDAGDNAVSITEHSSTARPGEAGKTVFDKIGRPSHFPAIVNLKASKVSLAWEGLYQYMLVNGVELNVCSPNISTYELYRFTTEELFYVEVEDATTSDLVYSFIYDDFHPDHKYDNLRAAIDDCVSCIFSKKNYEWMHFFRNENLTLNSHGGLNKEDFRIRVQAFQSSFRSFSSLDIRARSVVINDLYCHVRGTYTANGETTTELLKLDGHWLVQFEFDEKIGFWEINRVRIKGISL